MTSSTGFLEEQNESISNQPLKTLMLLSKKIACFFQTVLESETRSLLPTVWLDFSSTLDMSDRQIDQFARPSDSLSNSLNITCKN